MDVAKIPLQLQSHQLVYTPRFGSMGAARIQLPVVLTPNNGWTASVRIHAAITTSVQQIHAVSHTVCAMTTLTIVNASMDITSRSLKTNVFVIHGARGKSLLFWHSVLS